MWLGLDDTDALDGGCTTLEFHRLLQALPVPYGQPRLTRLWPFAPGRTRGNASLSVEIEADESIVSWLDKYWREHILPLKGRVAESDHSTREQHPADPGMVLFKDQPPESYYSRAVREKVEPLDSGWQWGGAGRIGATASCAWRAERVTFEGIAWRSGERLVGEEALSVVDAMEGTFLCRDPRTQRGLIAPRGPCPIMFGVRAQNLETARKATQLLVESSAPTMGSRVFATNQASGDHLLGGLVAQLKTKRLVKGGHVEINDRFLSFNEGGDVNTIAQWLEIGDLFHCQGMEHDEKIHIESLKVLSAFKQERPLCECGTRMKSMGREQGLRCPSCKLRCEDDWISIERIPPVIGWAQPPSDRRRHLAIDLSQPK